MEAHVEDDDVVRAVGEDFAEQLVDMFGLVLRIDPQVDVGLALKQLRGLALVAIEDRVPDEQHAWELGVLDDGFLDAPALAVGLEAFVGLDRSGLIGGDGCEGEEKAEQGAHGVEADWAEVGGRAKRMGSDPVDRV